jgi:hypothetical protein
MNLVIADWHIAAARARGCAEADPYIDELIVLNHKNEVLTGTQPD